MRITRRTFLASASSAALVSSFAPRLLAATGKQRLFFGSGTSQGILTGEWNGETGEISAVTSAAPLPDATWIAFSADHKFLFAASEGGMDNGKPIGRVSSFGVDGATLTPLSAQNSASAGTCHVALDHTGHVLIAADYGGGAASFLINEGKLSPAIWSQRFTGQGPNQSRQQNAHAHFVSYSPDNRFVYINDLGSDCIRIFKLNPATAQLTPAGQYNTRPGAGPRTLHFHPNGHTAYCVNELDSTVDVLEWKAADGSLRQTAHFEMLPAGYKGDTRACDTVISRDGRSVYFANRDLDFLYHFRADAKTGALTPAERTPCGGKIPRNFTLDPSERWMLVANQNSSLISVFARNPATGELAKEGKSFAVPTPMCILFL